MKFVIFILSSFFIVLLLLSFYNEHLLLNLNISKNKPILWYLSSIRYLPKDFKDEYNSIEMKKKITSIFEYQIYTFFKEYFSVLIIPYSLLVLSNYVENILDVILNNLEYDNTLGYIDKNSNFRSLNEKSNDKKVISFSEFRIKYPDWGTNIELYQLGDNSKLINREVNINLKMHTTYDSNISII